MSALPQAVSDALWDAQSTSPCEEERRAFDALRSAISSALAAETKLREEAEREVERLEGDRDRWVAKFAEADRLTLGIVRDRDVARARATRAEGALRVCEAALDGMDQSGGDRDGMPECPWCHSDSAERHDSDCGLAIARKAIAAARALAGEAQKEGTNG
jgi:hypothetical protein